MRFLAHVSEDGVITPQVRERVTRWRGRNVWVSVHEQPTIGIRSDPSNRRLWGVVYRAISEATGNDPESIHYGMKRLAVAQGVLDPQFILLGDKLVEDEPTTRTDPDTFQRYMGWCEHYALHDLGIHIPEEGGL
jgi:hypothetical protein